MGVLLVPVLVRDESGLVQHLEAGEELPGWAVEQVSPDHVEQTPKPARKPGDK